MKLCDKCGGDMPYPMAAMKFPSFRISKNPGFSMPFQDIDLCPECSKKLDAWLKARPAEPVRISGFDGLVCGNCNGAPVFQGDIVCPKCGAEIVWKEDSDAEIH